MTRHRCLFGRRAILWGALVALAAGASPSARAEGRADAVRVDSAQPQGFDALLQPQLAVADVYFGGRAIGQARVRYLSGRVTILDVDALIALVPDILDTAAVRAALAASDLDSHAALVCPPDADPDRTACGTLKPATAGVIFDEGRFRLDLFVNPKLMAVHRATERDYLPKPESGLSLVDQFGGTIAGSGGARSGSGAIYGVQNRAILGLGEGRIRNELSYASGYGLSVESLVAELDKPGLRYSAGAMWVPGIELVGRRRMVGAGVQSQIDTRLDRSAIAGTPLIVSLASRARVDVIRDGRLLLSRTYEAGNQTIDSTGMPDGAYEVVLHIQEAGGSVRDERRFFTKNALIAAKGEPLFFAYAGLLGEDRRDAPIAVTRTPFYQAGFARRFTPHLALDATMMGTDRTAIVELGGYWLTRAAQVRLAGLGSVRGDAGVFVQANSSGDTRVNYSIDARRIWAKNDRPLIPVGYDRYPVDIVTIDRNAQLSAGSFTQVNATISYNLQPGQIGVTASYRRDPRFERSYAIGPSVYVPLIERAGVQVTLRGDATLSNHGTSAFLGLSFQRLRSTTALSASAGVRSTSRTGYRDGTTPVGTIGASWQRSDVLGGDASLAGSVEREVAGTLVRGRADLRTARAALYADVAQPIEGRNGATQYSLSFRTTAAVTRHGIALQGRDQNDSAILVGVGGVAKGTPFEVLVDNAPRGIVHAGSQLSISVPAYRRYAVRLRPTGTDIVRVDGGTRQVSLYPGTVQRLDWAVERVVAMFGRIIWTDGSPVADAALFATGAIGNTDANGFFQIEAGGNATMRVQTADGYGCRLPLRAPALSADQTYAPLGTLVCPRALPSRMVADAAP